MKNLVLIKDNQTLTTSKIIADVFGKLHKNIIRDIENLEIPDYFRKLNFELSYYHAGKRNYPMYEITRDGFTLLAMGFTGKKAMDFKIKYIEAFNRMEETIKKNLQVENTKKLPARKQSYLSESERKIAEAIIEYGEGKFITGKMEGMIEMAGKIL